MSVNSNEVTKVDTKEDDWLTAHFDLDCAETGSFS